MPVPLGFASVYRREFRFVWIAARRFGVEPSAIDDAVQDVFLTALRRWSDLRPEASPRAWLYGVTRRIAFRYRRGDGRRDHRAAVLARSEVESETSRPHAAVDEAHDVDRILAELPGERREVFVMSELLGFTAPEIAVHQGVGVNTIYSRLRLARQQLERRLAGGSIALVDALVRRDTPPPQAEARTWAVLMAAVPAIATPTAALAPLGAAIAAGVVAVLATVAVLGSPTNAATAGRHERLQGVDEPQPIARRTPPAQFEAPLARAAAIDPPVPVVRPRASAPIAAPASTPLDLAAQIALLDRARAELRAGAAEAALASLDEHARRVDDGPLLDVREATRVRALCQLGRRDEARVLAERLRRERPDSAVAAALEDACTDA